jgi:hypothetical protein
MDATLQDERKAVSHISVTTWIDNFLSIKDDLGVALEVYRVSLTSACSLSNAKWWTQRSSSRRQVTTRQWKIKPPVCLIKHPQSIVEYGGTAPSFNQTTEGGEWSALRPGHIYPRERASRYSMNMRNGPQSWSGCFRHKYLAPIEKRTLIPRSPSP